MGPGIKVEIIHHEVPFTRFKLRRRQIGLLNGAQAILKSPVLYWAKLTRIVKIILKKKNTIRLTHLLSRLIRKLQ